MNTVTVGDGSDMTDTGVAGYIGGSFGNVALDATASFVSLLDDETDATTDLTMIGLGLEYAFDAPGRRFVPFVGVGVRSMSAASEICDEFIGCFDGTMTGIGFGFGGGLRYFFGNAFGIEAGIDLTSGSFSEAEFEGETGEIEEDVSVNRLFVGFTWQPGRGEGGEDEPRGGGGPK